MKALIFEEPNNLVVSEAQSPSIDDNEVMILSRGLFLIVINAGLLWTTDKLIDGFEIDGIFSTLVASVLISILDIALRWVLPWV